MKLVLDTSAASRVMHRRQSALQRLAERRPGEVYLSAPVAAEILFGLELLSPGSHRRSTLDQEYRRLRGAVRWADWTEAAAGEFARQKGLLQGRGQLVEDMDIAIASIAIVIGARLATCNARHMSRIEGLVVEDWDGPQ